LKQREIDDLPVPKAEVAGWSPAGVAIALSGAF
jgi:hypothetical protein